MDIIMILLPACLIFSALAVAAFFWAVKSGQMDDLETPAIRMLFDDERKTGEVKPTMKKKTNITQEADTDDDKQASKIKGMNE